MPLLIDAIGWRMTFVANAILGLIWGAVCGSGTGTSRANTPRSTTPSVN